MELGDSLHVEQIAIPDGSELMTEGQLTIATVLVPRGLKDGEGEAVVEEGEAAEGEAAAEGEEGKDKDEGKAEGDDK